MVVGLDPGTTHSALVGYDPRVGIVSHWYAENDACLLALHDYHAVPGDVLVIEQIAAMGMSVGAEVFETVFWSGRFAQAWQAKGYPFERLKRVTIKTHLCGQARAKDANVRQALLDRFGGQSETKKGGALHGITGDRWSALAVAVTWTDLHYHHILTSDTGMTATSRGFTPHTD